MNSHVNQYTKKVSSTQAKK